LIVTKLSGQNTDKTKPDTAIYDPPKKGFPYVVVVMDEGQLTAVHTAESRQKARMMTADIRKANHPAQASHQTVPPAKK
jgi:hypothetical protein